MIFGTRVKNLYPYLHVLILLWGFLWYFVAPQWTGSKQLYLYILMAYACVVLTMHWFFYRRYFGADTHYLISQFFDAALISAIVRITGNLSSDFYLAYFPVVLLLSVYSLRWRSIIGAAWFGICYLLAVYTSNFGLLAWQTALIRLSSIWMIGLVAFSVAHFMRSYEQKLLKTLDILNERTWELETSQVQLSNIYETTRVLSGILNIEQLLGEILRVAGEIFRYRICNVFLSDYASDSLYRYASLENSNRHIYERPEPYNRGLLDLKDLENNISSFDEFGREGTAKNANLADIALVSRGKVIGILQVLTESGNLPSPRERRLLMIFANAAAVAIDNSLLHKKTQELTITDELTEQFNYRYFRNRLTDELRRADRYRQQLSVLMLDLDHFKKVNDRYGHQTGNIILKEVANIIKQCVRDVDVVARYGGEEFVVILPQTEEIEATVIAERIRDTVAKNNFVGSHGERNINVTVSIGGATYPDGVHTLEQLLEKVDQTMYRAKAEGRNLVRFAGRSQRRATEVSSD